MTRGLSFWPYRPLYTATWVSSSMIYVWCMIWHLASTLAIDQRENKEKFAKSLISLSWKSNPIISTLVYLMKLSHQIQPTCNGREIKFYFLKCFNNLWMYFKTASFAFILFKIKNIYTLFYPNVFLKLFLVIIPKAILKWAKKAWIHESFLI